MEAAGAGRGAGEGGQAWGREGLLSEGLQVARLWAM